LAATTDQYQVVDFGRGFGWLTWAMWIGQEDAVASGRFKLVGLVAVRE
jgi:hypothetical protein